MKSDFTFIDDITVGTKSVIQKNYKCEIFNLGNNRSEKLMDLMKIIEDELSIEALIDFEPMQPGDVKETYADIEKSMRKLKFNPKIRLSEGISKFVSWYKDYI